MLSMLLHVRELRTYFETPAGTVRAVDGVSLSVPRAHTLALVGESGCGKSLTALSILRLVPPPGRVVGGSIHFRDRDLLTLTDREIRTIRGRRIAMIFQEPMTSLNPLMTIGQQIDEVLRLHGGFTRRAAREKSMALLRSVGIPAACDRVGDYPHQLSGGMRQRAMIATALAGQPELLIADEPTTALDVTVQAQILALLSDLQQQNNVSVLLITHDLGVVAHTAHTVAIMYAGRIVEQSPTRDLLRTPQHPYTQGLLQSMPRLSSAARTRPPGARLPVIPGEVPDALRRPSGCPFHPRCELGREDARCRSQNPPLLPVQPEHLCACWKAPGYPQNSGGGAIVAKPAVTL
jgi:oligopeptide/dipeptide ABC transporter ATP-binding protein